MPLVSAHNLLSFCLSISFNREGLTFLVAVNVNYNNACVLKPYDILNVKNALLKYVPYVTEYTILDSVPLRWMQLFQKEGDKKLPSPRAPPIHCKVLHFIWYKLIIYCTEPLNKLLTKELCRYWYNSSFDNECVVIGNHFILWLNPQERNRILHACWLLTSQRIRSI